MCSSDLQQRGVVDDVVVAADLRVLVLEGVEAVGAGDDDAGGPGLVEHLDVLGREHLEEVLVAHPTGGVAGAALAGAEDREVDTRRLQQRRRRARGRRPPGGR